ncbi:unnamed protein product [Cylicostephanus goldi]|uniref:Protein kinase domain-containing protein n=1 Tax=Cylicostephanus goldi TaxID=71465 RepID=A0A3P6SZ61_CYLGO|nr:unnamed protein product [Cylicostephanus goldi]
MLGRTLSMSSFDETLVNYHFVYIEKISLSPINFHVKIHVAQQVEQEEICFVECYKTVRKKDFMRRLATSAICALKYLHDQKLSHGYIVPHSVWCSKATIRFSDACLK